MNIKNKLSKMIIEIFSIPIFVSILGWILFSLSYLLPVSNIIQNLNQSIDEISTERFANIWMEGAEARNDDWSEGMIISMAVKSADKSDIFIAPLNLCGISVGDLGPTESVAAYVSDPSIDYKISSNNRYWNGLVMILKLELSFFNLTEVRLLNMLIQLILLGIIFYMMGKQNMKDEMIPFLFMIMVMNPATLSMSLKLIPEYIIMLAGCIFILSRPDAYFKNSEKAVITFSVIGSLTSFFNMLSFPLITFGIPVMFYIWKTKRITRVKIKTVLAIAVSWCMGYLVCWFCKWIACTLFTDENLIANALARAERYHNIDEDYLATALRNLTVYNRKIYIFVFLLSIAWFLLKALLSKSIKIKESLPELVVYCGLIILPYIFFAAVGPGYAYIHHYMAYRNLSFSFASIICIFMAVISSKVRH